VWRRERRGEEEGGREGGREHEEVASSSFVGCVVEGGWEGEVGGWEEEEEGW